MKKVLVNFHIGRGGHFNNPGHVTFCGCSSRAKNMVENNNYINYENSSSLYEEFGEDVTNVITDLDLEIEGDNFEAFEKKYGKLGKLILFSCDGNEIGDYVENGEAYYYEEDTHFDTTYGYLIESFEDLTEKEKAAVMADQYNRSEIERELGIDQRNRLY